ncbi:MAG: GNAT family N-acetyltransferase [Pseudomonadota bacterium]
MLRAFNVPTDGALPSYVITPFDPDTHDRTAFSCGLDRIDNFLKLTAKKHQQGDFSRVFVACTGDSNAVVGYYALNAHALTGEGLPEALTKRGPRHGIPAAYLSMICVDQAHQGQGLGVLLLADALMRVLHVSDTLGLKAVILDVVDDDGEDQFERRKAFYARMGFQAFSNNDRRMFLTLKDIAAAFQQD